MKLVCISDTHCKLNKIKLPDGDILIHAGDALSRGTESEFLDFIYKLKKIKVKYKYIIYVPGNHDIITEQDEDFCKRLCASAGVIYLNNSGVTLEGIRFWGSAVTPRFHNWAWNRDSGTSGTSYKSDDSRYDPIQPYWDQIPDDIDVLITHGPPKGILDVSIYNGENCGCQYLLDKVMEIQPKYHVFGHIHHYGGSHKEINNIVFVNAAVCDEQYKASNKVKVVEI